MLNFNNNIQKPSQETRKKNHNKSNTLHISSTQLKKEQLSYNELIQKSHGEREKSLKKTPSKSINKSKSNGKNSYHRLLTSYSQTKITNRNKNYPNESKKGEANFKYLEQKLETDRLMVRKSSEKYGGKNARIKTDYYDAG